MSTILLLPLLQACGDSAGDPATVDPTAGATAACRSDPYDPVVREGASYEFRLVDGGWAKFSVKEVTGDRARTEMLLQLPGEPLARADTEHPCAQATRDTYTLAGLPRADMVSMVESCVPERPALAPGVRWSCRQALTLDIDGRQQEYDVREDGEAVDGGWIETPAGRFPTLKVLVRQTGPRGKVWTRERWVAAGLGTVRSEEAELVAYHLPEE